MVTLTNEDRDRFAAYLEQSAKDDDALAKQCDAIGQPRVGLKMRTEAAAAMLIARKLRTTEFQTVTIDASRE
jgi:hypothetical protein